MWRESYELNAINNSNRYWKTCNAGVRTDVLRRKFQISGDPSLQKIYAIVGKYHGLLIGRNIAVIIELFFWKSAF